MFFSWRSGEDELAIKYLENLEFWISAVILNDVKYSICSSLDFEYKFWVIIFTQERAPQQTFTYLKSTKKHWRKVWKLFKANNKDTRTTLYSMC